MVSFKVAFQSNKTLQKSIIRLMRTIISIRILKLPKVKAVTTKMKRLGSAEESNSKMVPPTSKTTKIVVARTRQI